MKDPALLWCGVNSALLIGGGIMLYQTNVKLAAQVDELKQIVNMLNEQNKNQPEVYKKIDEAISKLDMGVGMVATQLSQHQEYLNYLNSCSESMSAEITKSSPDYVQPRKPAKIKKLMKMISFKQKKSRETEESDDDSSSSDSSSEEDEDPAVLLKKRREAKARAKAKAKAKAKDK